MGLTVNGEWCEPYDSTNSSDIEAAERRLQFQFGWFANPIFSKTGDWPPVMKKFIGDKSAAAGFAESRLPPFTSEEIHYVKGLSNFQNFFLLVKIFSVFKIFE